MTKNSPVSPYALGSTESEHERLIWQAQRAAPATERLFREAGVGLGQRVLDIGSGVGDVAILLARLVGPSGEVVGIERESTSIAKARARVAEARLRNVTFTQSDVGDIPGGKPFDAAVGRFILMFLPDPVAVLRSLVKVVRPGGVLAFLEPSWAPVLARLAPLPLWSRTASLILDTFQRTGANTEMGADMYYTFQSAGLPAPTMRLEMPLGKDPDFAEWFSGLIRTLQPLMLELALPVESLGNLDTLQERLQAEVDASQNLAAWMAPVGAWARNLGDLPLGFFREQRQK
jgi:ubiquinone/menaquinone biosynthesis C-methylase UbiE